MKKKKSLVFVMSIVLVLILSVTLVACDGNNDTTGGGNTDTGGGNTDAGGVIKEANLTSKIDLKTNTANHKEQYDLFVEDYKYGKVFVGSIEEATKETEEGGLLEGLVVDTYGSIGNQENVVKNGQFIWKQYKNGDNISTYLVPMGDVIYLETAPDRATVDYYADLFRSDYIVDGKYLINSWSSEKVYTFVDNNTEMVNGLRLSADKKTLINGNNATGDVTVPETVTEVKKYAFVSNNNITSVMLSNNITELSKYTFYKCNNLTKINIPRELEILKNGVFNCCNNIKEIIFDKDSKLRVIYQNFIYIKDDAESVKVKNIVLPKSVEILDYNAFRNWNELETFSVEEGSNLKYIGCDLSYYTEEKLRENNFIAGQIFNPGRNTEYLSLHTIDLSNATQLVKLNDSLCNKCSIKNVILPKHITNYSVQMFDGCNFTSYEVPTQITTLDRSCFTNTQLRTLVLHKKITKIGDYQFTSSIYLETIKFNGTIAEWNAIEKGKNLVDSRNKVIIVECTDGNVELTSN